MTPYDRLKPQYSRLGGRTTMDMRPEDQLPPWAQPRVYSDGDPGTGFDYSQPSRSALLTLSPSRLTPQGMPLNYISGVGDEAGDGEQQGGGLGDIGALLGAYLKKRQGASPADAKKAWEAGGSL